MQRLLAFTAAVLFTTAAAVGRLLVELHGLESMILVVATHSPALALLMQQQFELDAGVLKKRGTS